MTLYKIIRFYKDINIHHEVIRENITKHEAINHCRNSKTSTEDYFDGYAEMKAR